MDRAHERVRKRGGTPEQARGERRRLTGTGGAAQALHDGVVREDCLGGEDGLDRFSGAERAQEDDGGGGPAKLALVVVVFGWRERGDHRVEMVFWEGRDHRAVPQFSLYN
ncbi:MAG: hypothetical protein WAL10_25445 [Acetobacteraceae bacterium]